MRRMYETHAMGSLKEGHLLCGPFRCAHVEIALQQHGSNDHCLAGYYDIYIRALRSRCLVVAIAIQY